MRLPLFPLPLVLFPGASLPLHVFEPRYRALLADCQAADGRFGVVLSTGAREAALPPGHVGCVAELREVQSLPDGRSNLLVEGAERFALTRVDAGARPYLVAEATAHEDDPGEPADDALRALAARVTATFTQVARAARRIADDDEPLPPLPADPALLSFRIAALVDFDVALRQALLMSRSPIGRLHVLADALEQAVGPIEERARVHTGARKNGHGPVPPGAGAGPPGTS